MKLNLHKASATLLNHLRCRIRDYPVYVNAGPGEDEDRTSQISLGFQFDQAGWAEIVVDTLDEIRVQLTDDRHSIAEAVSRVLAAVGE